MSRMHAPDPTETPAQVASSSSNANKAHTATPASDGLPSLAQAAEANVGPNQGSALAGNHKATPPAAESAFDARSTSSCSGSAPHVTTETATNQRRPPYEARSPEPFRTSIENEPPLELPIIADKWHAEGAAVVYRWFIEHFQLHQAAVESRYGLTGLFVAPSAFPGGEARWNATWDNFVKESESYRPLILFEEATWWPQVQTQVQAMIRAASPEELASEVLRERLFVKIHAAVMGRLSNQNGLAEMYKSISPRHMRRLCEDAREKLLTIGHYETRRPHIPPCQEAQMIGASLPVTNGWYRPRTLLTAIWALADRVRGSGRPQLPLHEVDADGAAALLAQMIDWCDQQQAEMDQGAGLLGVWRPSLGIAQPPVPLSAQNGDRADGRADALKKKRRKKPLPENEDARRLALDLARKLPAGEQSRNEIAAEFTGGDSSKASSLLRIIRKYPDLKSMVDRADPKKK